MNRVLLAAVFFVGLALSASGAGYIKFDGVDGESQAQGHAGESDILSWSWGVHRAEADGSGSGRTRAAAIVEDLVVTKELDKASVKLLEGCLQGKVYPTATLTLEQAGATGGQFTYLVIEMENVSVLAYEVGDAQGQNRPTESVSINFEEVTVTYTVRNADGSSGGNVETTWKVEEGES